MQPPPLSQISNTRTKFNSPKSLFFYSFLGNCCKTINGSCSTPKGKLAGFENMKQVLLRQGQNFRAKIHNLDTKWSATWRPPALQSHGLVSWRLCCGQWRNLQAQEDFLGCLGCLWELQSEADSPAQLKSFTPSGKSWLGADQSGASSKGSPWNSRGPNCGWHVD